MVSFFGEDIRESAIDKRYGGAESGSVQEPRVGLTP